jgi:hypothetical protein
MLRLLVLLFVTLSLSGCASSLGTFFNRPVVEDNIQGQVTTVSLAADRRVVLVSHLDDTKGKFCAEPPPDSATGLKTDLDIAFKKKEALDFGLKDKLETTVTVLARRTANLDMFRTGVYALCQFALNGHVKPDEVKLLFERLIKAYETVQAQPSASDPPPVADKK